MPTIELYLSLKIDGDEANGFPLRRRLEVDEVQRFNTQEADDGNDTTFSALPVGEVDSVQVLVYDSVDQATGVRLEGGEATNVAVRLNAGGLVAVFNGTLTDTNLTVNNNSGAVARIKGLAGGT